MKDLPDGEYATTDLYYAAYLQCSGARMIRSDKSGSGRLTFIFDRTVVNIEELKTAWFNQSGKVVAQQYANCVKNLKHICHMP
jgi:hypothetical protein